MEPLRQPLGLRLKAPPVRRIDTGALLATSREVILVHNDQEYRLRITSNDKLILTK